MCLGRNYHVIHSIEATYPYDVLVCILKSQGTHYTVIVLYYGVYYYVSIICAEHSHASQNEYA
jgi:hypothetical protein